VVVEEQSWLGSRGGNRTTAIWRIKLLKVGCVGRGGLEIQPAVEVMTVSELQKATMSLSRPACAALG